MSDIYELVQRPELDEPLLIVTLEGWVDAGLGAATALAALLGSVPTEVVAGFDVDSLLDHRARRPVVRIVDGVNSSLMWPEIQLRSG
ncbi:MAG: PAC2 family protein, partial [Acidimicrobiia bacterium]|nr:PAC2 family protein [Acidimicrobiia bacterium]